MAPEHFAHRLWPEGLQVARRRAAADLIAENSIEQELTVQLQRVNAESPRSALKPAPIPPDKLAGKGISSRIHYIRMPRVPWF